MKKIAVASIMQETCSFYAVRTTLENLKAGYFREGPDVVNVPPTEAVVGGFVDGVKGRNFRMEGIIAIHDIAGGELTAGAFSEVRKMLLSGMRKKGPFDAVFLNLHGAMVADGEPDTEGVILEDVRKLVGKDCFIGVTVDHHANLTKRMVGASDVMVAFETQPHDLPATGAKLARVMLDIWENKRTPHAAMVKIPMLTPQDQFLTAFGPMKEWFDMAREIERDPAVIAASTFPTQPWLDVPESGWSTLVYADTDEKARSHARKLAQKAWDMRAQFWRSERLSLPNTVAAANAEPKGLVVISDTGDSTWGGAPGDSTALIIEMRKQGLKGTALVPLVDPAALNEAARAGTGRKITLRLGGKHSAAYSPSLELTGVVGAITEPGLLVSGDGISTTVGRSALFDCGDLKIAILESRDRSINNPTLYQKLGIDVAKARMVVLKTASNFQYFKEYQSRLIRADSPGATQSDLTALTWKNISHPTYPFDDIKDWKAPVKKIAVASIMQETCSFYAVKTTLEDFKASYFKQGRDVVNVPADEWLVGPFVAAMKPKNHQLVGIVAIHDIAGGEVSASAFSDIKAMLLAGLKKAGPFDAVYLNLHGAMAAEGEPDTEGVLLAEVRKLVGKNCFIGVSLDHHANLTKRMVDAADVMVAFDTHPHDLIATGAKAARVMLDIWENKRTPHAAFIKIPMLSPQDQFLTAAGPMKEWFDMAREIEMDPAVIAVSTYPTQPWLDVPESGWSTLVYADTSEKAQSHAKRLARKAWDMRDLFWRSERLSLADTIAAANAESKGLVVISDTGDSTFGGAPGDSMAIVAEMLKQGVNGPALIPVVDPEAMEQAMKARQGGTITLRVGGKLSAAWSPSLEMTGVVGGRFEGGGLDFGDGISSRCGRSALLECGNLKIAILELRDRSINHPALYEKLGVDVSRAKMAVLKTASNFQNFQKYRSRLIRADSPGATQSDLTAFTWKNISHPTYPFDEINDWKP